MALDEVEIGRKYVCDYRDNQYFATVVRKGAHEVVVTLGDMLNKDGDSGCPTNRLGCIGQLSILPESLHLK